MFSEALRYSSNLCLFIARYVGLSQVLRFSRCPALHADLLKDGTAMVELQLPFELNGQTKQICDKSSG